MPQNSREQNMVKFAPLFGLGSAETPIATSATRKNDVFITEK
jgi:hypothetical protein